MESREALVELLTSAGYPADVLLRSWVEAGREEMPWKQAFEKAGSPQLARDATGASCEHLTQVLRHIAGWTGREAFCLAQMIKFHADTLDLHDRSAEAIVLYDAVLSVLQRCGAPELSPEKTKITHNDDGFDFLGQNVRRYRCGKVLVKPSSKNVQTFLGKIRETIRRSGSWTAGELIHRLNQQIKGWAMYHRYAASKRTFNLVDQRIFRMVKNWCRHRHQNKTWKWIKKKYYRKEGHRHWIFSGTLPDKESKGIPISLMEAGRVKVRRYVKIRSDANPYDPEWELYLEERLYWQLEGTLAGRGRIEYLWKSQEGRCVRCGQALRPSEKPWHIHHRHWHCDGGSDTVDNVELLHKHCHHQIHYGSQKGRQGAASCERRTGMPEPYDA
jgi:hypothetical protein